MTKTRHLLLAGMTIPVLAALPAYAQDKALNGERIILAQQSAPADADKDKPKTGPQAPAKPAAPPPQRPQPPAQQRPQGQPPQQRPQGQPPQQQRPQAQPPQQRPQAQPPQQRPQQQPQTAPQRPQPPATRPGAPQQQPSTQQPPQQRPGFQRPAQSPAPAQPPQQPAQQNAPQLRPGAQPQQTQTPAPTQRQPQQATPPAGQPTPAQTQTPNLRPGTAPAQVAPQQQGTPPQQGFRREGGPRRVEDLRGQRREQREGNRTVIQENDRTIVREGNRTFIRHDETDRIRAAAGRNANVRVEQRGRDTQTVVVRPGGIQIINVVGPDGRLIRRSRRGPDGREIVIIDNRPRGPAGFFVQLPPPRIRIPRERYIYDWRGGAGIGDVYDILMLPPVEPLQRAYSLDEIRYSPDVRDRMPRVDLDTITFDTGSWDISPDQMEQLSVIAQAILRAVEQNPAEVFLIEGHTDAVGADIDNLSLSDRRAESVALALTEQFGVPPENLTSQGYGEQYLKVPVDGPERANRRVTVRRITPLLSGQNQP